MRKRGIGKRGDVSIDTLIGIIKNVAIAILIIAGVYLVVTGKLQGAVEKIIDTIRYGVT